MIRHPDRPSRAEAEWDDFVTKQERDPEFKRLLDAERARLLAALKCPEGKCVYGFGKTCTRCGK